MQVRHEQVCSYGGLCEVFRNGVNGAVVVRGVAGLQGGRGYNLSGCEEVVWRV